MNGYMRWRYPDPDDHAENARREAVIDRIDGWWKAFKEATPLILGRLQNQNEFDIPAFLHESLHAIDPNLMWEFGPKTRGSGHRLVITCEHIHCLRPMVRDIIRRAPKMDGWEFLPCRVAESAEMAESIVYARTGRKSTCKGVDVRPSKHGQIDLEFYFPTIGYSERTAFEEAFVLTETLLGEEVLNIWIGQISARSALVGSGKLKLAGLHPAVDSIIHRYCADLPQSPRWKNPGDGINYGMFDLGKHTREQTDDVSRDDLVTLTIDSQIGAAFLTGPLFYSVRHSRHGETFCFIQIDNSAQELPHSIATRSTMEDALDNALVPKGLGCVIGSGFGTKHLSIELALTNVPACLPIVRDVLSSFSVPKKTWLLFHDVELAAEWYGIWPDTPEPRGIAKPGTEISATAFKP
ncbi:MAG: hypothetical protein KF784_05620 [Fimbriimonadaceae bacterium]|nr:hypothetical protein [Fimbriimonadaceae bacterium]